MPIARFEVRHVKFGPTVTCLVTKDNFFIGGVITSENEDEPWAFALDRNGNKILELRAGEHKGQKIRVLFDRCQHALLTQWG
jgi:hypothetical protein